MTTPTRPENEEKNLWLRALDPVHVGTGGIRLSHVDMQIVREPGSNLPKIPATTLSGNIRTGAARWWRNRNPAEHSFCAGVGTREKPHCGKCPVCRGFGTSREGSERMGALTFTDALLLFFPIYSFSHGPLWMTSHGRRGLAAGLLTLPDSAAPDRVYTSQATDMLILGRRMFTIGNDDRCSLHSGTLPEPLQPLHGSMLAVVPDDLFSMLVNENLEVRTSVSIDPMTGTARQGALFTYEALPRTSILRATVALDGRRWPSSPEEGWPDDPFTLVEEGSKPLALAGLGGMTSRGFGRVQAVCREVTP